MSSPDGEMWQTGPYYVITIFLLFFGHLNTDIFAWVSFSQNFSDAKFLEKNSRKMLKSLCHLQM